MTRLSDIPVRVDLGATPTTDARGISAAGLAILYEIETLLEQYQAFGQNGSIDLRWLSLLPGDLDRLHEMLGTGEVSAQVDALGISTARETAIQCVWWVEHYGPDGESHGQWIEITEVPSLLRSDRASIAYGLETLRDRISSFSGERQ
ncbi:MAG: hydrogenase expression/formation protein [Sterolibacteriaceae bacterium]|jgi:hypothetical protein|nr:hydrogenase expression/formation protein [Sterolibacteriaceae bacterium]MBK9086755.1 hydrogenase expression/formation protein [Sterolibacteriaceae bacterium]